jgi:sugar/nucleoside kinase (ribokinase family)
MTINRLVGLGSIVVDLVLHVDRLPDRAGDVLASSSVTRVGGGLNVLAAATAAGLPTAYAGGHGTGPFGDLVRARLVELGIPALLAPSAIADTGFCVVLVDDTGERTFVTTVGAEGRLTAEQVAGPDVTDDDAVYVSGYDLAYPHAEVVADLVTELPREALVVLDPGPLVADIDPDLLAGVLARTRWLSLNAREAALWTGLDNPAAALDAVLATAPDECGVVLRTGPEGAVVASRGRDPVTVPGVPVERVTDTTGAGDVHVGAFVAALAAGLEPVTAVRQANAAAAAAVSKRAP